MQILLIRHGIAEDLEAWAKTGHPEEERPLTKAGRRKMRGAARGLRRVIPKITVLASSPLTRAAQTADAVAKEFSDVKFIQISQLSPRKPLPALLNWLQTQPRDAIVALVGHEPQLSTFAGWITTGLQESFILLKKAGACLLESGEELKPGRGKLKWVLKPSQLRRLGH